MTYLSTLAICLFANACLAAPQGSLQPQGQAQTHRKKTPSECGPVVLILKPVCGSDGKTYDSSAALSNYNCIQGLEGTAEEIKSLGDGCCREEDLSGSCKGHTYRPKKTPEECGPVELVLKPVCGSDGIKYPNKSALDSHNCIEGLTGTPNEVKVARRGDC